MEGGFTGKGIEYKSTFMGNATGDDRFYTDSDGNYVDGLAYGSVIKVEEYKGGELTGEATTYLVGLDTGQKGKFNYEKLEPKIAAQANLSYGRVYKGTYNNGREKLDMEIEHTETGTYAVNPDKGFNSKPVWAPAGSKVMYIEGDLYPVMYTPMLLEVVSFNPYQEYRQSIPLLHHLA